MIEMNNPTTAKLDAYLSRVQEDSTSLFGILQGIDILMEDDRGKHAIAALMPIALDTIRRIDHALDSAVWPEALDGIKPA